MIEVIDGTLYISMVEFCQWVNSKLPRDIQGSDVVFGPPLIRGVSDNIEIHFSSSNEEDPRTWTIPPKALGEWARVAKLTQEILDE